MTVAQYHCHACGVRVLVSKGSSWVGTHYTYVGTVAVGRTFALCPDHYDRYKETL
jgi:hypothetical protein